MTRTDRRKARTRQALVSAAQELLAAGRTEVSIQEITELADVGFGSFYNHFASKAELFDAAVMESLDEHGQLLRELTDGIEDPAEVFAVSFRLTGRLQRVHPQLMRVMLRSGTAHLLADRGLAPLARRDIQAAAERGRFDVEDVDLALVCAGGMLLGLLQLLDARPKVDAAAVTDATTVRVLRMLGVPSKRAAALVARPLPEIPRAA